MDKLGIIYAYNKEFPFKKSKIAKVNKKEYKYLTKKQFKNYNDYNDTEVVGYTDFKKVNQNETEDNLFKLEEDYYVVNDKKPISVNKYINVGHSQKSNYFIGVKNRHFLLPILLLLLIASILGSFYVLLDNPENPEDKKDTTIEIDHNYIYMPILMDKTISKSNKFFEVMNPKENEDAFSLKFTFINPDTEGIIVESNWIESGKKEMINLYEALGKESGIYNVKVSIKSKSNNTDEESNNSSGTTLKITIK